MQLKIKKIIAKGNMPTKIAGCSYLTASAAITIIITTKKISTATITTLHTVSG